MVVKINWFHSVLIPFLFSNLGAAVLADQILVICENPWGETYKESLAKPSFSFHFAERIEERTGVPFDCIHLYKDGERIPSDQLLEEIASEGTLSIKVDYANMIKVNLHGLGESYAFYLPDKQTLGKIAESVEKQSRKPVGTFCQGQTILCMDEWQFAQIRDHHE